MVADEHPLGQRERHLRRTGRPAALGPVRTAAAAAGSGLPRRSGARAGHMAILGNPVDVNDAALVADRVLQLGSGSACLLRGGDRAQATHAARIRHRLEAAGMRVHEYTPPTARPEAIDSMRPRPATLVHVGGFGESHAQRLAALADFPLVTRASGRRDEGGRPVIGIWYSGRLQNVALSSVDIRAASDDQARIAVCLDELRFTLGAGGRLEVQLVRRSAYSTLACTVDDGVRATYHGRDLHIECVRHPGTLGRDGRPVVTAPHTLRMGILPDRLRTAPALP